MPGSADEPAAGYRPLLFSIAYGMTGSVGDAEDIVQDAFLGMTRARQAGTSIADPKAYLTTAVTRLGINYLNSARVQICRAELKWLMPSRVAAVVRYAFGSAITVPAWRARVRARNASCTMSSASATDPVIP